MAVSACVSKNLENPLLNGLGLGLNFIDNQQIELKVEVFPCCQGQARLWDQQLQAIRTCSLRARLSRVEKLYAQYRKIWPHSSRLPHQVSNPLSAQILQDLAAVFKRDRASTHLIISPHRQPSILWSQALASIWRFGIEARLINLTKHDTQELAQFTADFSGPIALFVEQIDRLWDPMYVEALEHIVTRAYHSEAFLWLDFLQVPESGKVDEGDDTVKAELQRRIQRKKQAINPLELLSKDCISRLQSMSGQQLRR